MLSFSGKIIKQFMLFCTFGMILVHFYSFAAEGAQVELAWDPSPSSEVSGYKLYYGRSSGNYTSNIDAKYNTGKVVSGLDEGQTYYFAATSYTASNLESEFSEEISYTIPYLDSDGDGITNADEIGIYGTNPDKSDSDGDGVNDGEELAFWQNNWDADFDGDSLINLLDKDSDNDGIFDGSELIQGNDPSYPDSNSEQILKWIEAEDGDLYDPMQRVVDSDASADEYIICDDRGICRIFI